jgi:murein DD-endopeptidase MepM/ murein hydrolase activator NlpD
MAGLRISYDDLVAKAADAQDHADRQLVMLDQREQELARKAQSLQAQDGSGASPMRVQVDASNSIRAKPENAFGQTLHWLGLARDRARSPVHHPSLDRLATDVMLLARLSRDGTQVMRAMEGGALWKMTGEKARIAGTGINTDQFLLKLEKVEGVGGPEVSLDKMQLDNVADRDFNRAYFRAEADLGELADLRRAFTLLPTASPLGPAVERTSGFGPRLDPFSGRYAFHPGVDFPGPTGTPVWATANGLVSFAGRDGSYGNLVEIDHGYGLRTRYAHLLNISVTKGQTVAKGAIVGHLGSTGRSTGPHVHYEIWYDNTVRNPDGFLRAGKLAGNDYCRMIACSSQRR